MSWMLVCSWLTFGAISFQDGRSNYPQLTLKIHENGYNSGNLTYCTKFCCDLFPTNIPKWYSLSANIAQNFHIKQHFLTMSEVMCCPHIWRTLGTSCSNICTAPLHQTQRRKTWQTLTWGDPSASESSYHSICTEEVLTVLPWLKLKHFMIVG